MLKNIMTQFLNLKLIFQRLLWLVSVPLLSSMLVVSLLTLTILYLVSLVVIWLLGVMLPKGLVSELMPEELEVSTHVLEAVRYNIRVLYLFLKNLKPLLSVVHKTEYEADQQQYTSQFGTKK